MSKPNDGGQAIAGLAANQGFIVRTLDGHKHEDTLDAIASAAVKIADAAIRIESASRDQ